MQIPDFLQKHVAPDAITLVASGAEIKAHLDAYLQQLWPLGRIAIVVEPSTREYAERQLLPALAAHGFETVYCLCVKSAGSTYQAQIDESLGDGELDGTVGMAALGSNALFASVRDRASLLGIPCCALLQELPDTRAFDPVGDTRPVPDALFFDLDAIASSLRGDIREAIQALELDLYALRADHAIAQALGAPFPTPALEALREAQPPRLPAHALPSEDDHAQLCEAYAWRAVAQRLMHTKGSLQAVMEYASAAPEMPGFLPQQHAQILAQILDAALELESLEISPEACANRQPPKAILHRTLQQVLLEDGLPFEWIDRADDGFEDRMVIRHHLNAPALAWDDICPMLKPIGDMMHAIAQTDDDPDPMLKNLWLHAARFAPKYSFLRIFNLMGLIEPALYI